MRLERHAQKTVVQVKVYALLIGPYRIAGVIGDVRFGNYARILVQSGRSQSDRPACGLCIPASHVRCGLKCRFHRPRTAPERFHWCEIQSPQVSTAAHGRAVAEYHVGARLIGRQKAVFDPQTVAVDLIVRPMLHKPSLPEKNWSVRGCGSFRLSLFLWKPCLSTRHRLNAGSDQKKNEEKQWHLPAPGQLPIRLILSCSPPEISQFLNRIAILSRSQFN